MLPRSDRRYVNITCIVSGECLYSSVSPFAQIKLKSRLRDVFSQNGVRFKYRRHRPRGHDPRRGNGLLRFEVSYLLERQLGQDIRLEKRHSEPGCRPQGTYRPCVASRVGPPEIWQSLGIL